MGKRTGGLWGKTSVRGIGPRSAIETSHSYKWPRGTTTRSRGAGSVAAAGQRASTAVRKDTWPESARSPSLAARVRPALATTVASQATSLVNALRSAKLEKLREEEPVVEFAITATRKDTLLGTVLRLVRSVGLEEEPVTTATRKATLLETAQKPRKALEADQEAGQEAVATVTTATSLDIWLGTVHRSARRGKLGINRR